MPTVSVFVDSQKAKIIAANRDTNSAVKFTMSLLGLQEPYARMIVGFLQEHSYNIYTIPEKVQFNVGEGWIKYQRLSAKYMSDYQFTGFEFQFAADTGKKPAEKSVAYLYTIRYAGYGDFEYQFISDNLLPDLEIIRAACQQLNSELVEVLERNSFKVRTRGKEFIARYTYVYLNKV